MSALKQLGRLAERLARPTLERLAGKLFDAMLKRGWSTESGNLLITRGGWPRFLTHLREECERVL